MARNRAGSAFAIAAFATGILIWFINPPSLSGAGGLLSLIIGTTAFVYVVAWLTVLLMGRDAMPEEDFERIVRRSEELARLPRAAREATEFELIVADAIDRLPPDLKLTLLLHHYERLSYREIAEITGCSEKGVDTRLYRAKQKLRATLGALAG